MGGAGLDACGRYDCPKATVGGRKDAVYFCSLLPVKAISAPDPDAVSSLSE